MLSPPRSGTSDAIETVEQMACDYIELERATDAASPVRSRLPLTGRKSRARIRCTWKDCNYRESNAAEMM